MAWQPRVAAHIPGVENVIPDKLSRWHGPSAIHELPEHVRHLSIECPPPRPIAYYRTLAAPAR
eukprot:1326619-Amphidinium_carterae.1